MKSYQMGAEQIVIEQLLSKDRLLYSEWSWNWITINTFKNELQTGRKQQRTWPIITILFHKTFVSDTYSYTCLLYEQTYIYIYISTHIICCGIKLGTVIKKSWKDTSGATTEHLDLSLTICPAITQKVHGIQSHRAFWSLRKHQLSNMFKEQPWITEKPEFWSELTEEFFRYQLKHKHWSFIKLITYISGCNSHHIMLVTKNVSWWN